MCMKDKERMKGNILLKAAGWLWMLVVVTAALLTSATQAKYTASGTAEISARVAKWAPFWRPVTAANGNTIAGSVGSLDSGYIIHPGNWTSKTITVHWRVTNKGEVAMRSHLEPRIHSGSWNTNGFSGDYAPVAAPGWNSLNNAQIRQWLSSGSITPENTTAVQDVPIGQSKWFSFEIKPNTNSSALAVGNRPANSRNSGDFNTAISQARPIVFDASGSNTTVTRTVNNMDTTWWRTIRINAAGMDVQVD